MSTSSLKILITNHALRSRAGTEMYVYDLALTLQKWGHKPFVYSPVIGKIGSDLQRATIPVIENIERLSLTPDIIHGHHHLPTLTALMHFPDVPAIYFCHGWVPHEESPLHFPRILRYVAVSQACYDRLICNGVSEDKIKLLLNFVDLERFKPRLPLPAEPKKALIFSNQADEQTNIPLIRQACAKYGIQLAVIGAKTNNATEFPESVLGEYDIVFAVGKSALEALAVGCAVIVCDYGRMGPMVSMKNVHRVRQMNFTLRAMTQPLTYEGICQEIASYNKEDAQLVSQFIREDACKNQCVEQLMLLYHDVIQEYKEIDASKPSCESQAVSQYLQSISYRLREEKTREVDAFTKEIDVVTREMDAAKNTFQMHAIKIQELDHKVTGIDHKVNGIDYKANGIDQKVNDINHKVNGIDHKIQLISKSYRFFSQIPLLGRLIKFIKNRALTHP